MFFTPNYLVLWLRSWSEPEDEQLIPSLMSADRALTVPLTDRKAWTMSALMELRGLSRITMKICSSFSRLMKFPNHDFLASLQGPIRSDQNKNIVQASH